MSECEACLGEEDYAYLVHATDGVFCDVCLYSKSDSPGTLSKWLVTRGDAPDNDPTHCGVCKVVIGEPHQDKCKLIPKNDSQIGTMQKVEPKDGDVAYFEDCVEGGYPYRVTLVWRHRDPAGQGWYNVSGVLKPLDVTGKTLHLLVRDGYPHQAKLDIDSDSTKP